MAEEEAKAAVDEEMTLPSQSPAEPPSSVDHTPASSEPPKRPREDGGSGEGDGEEEGEEEVPKKKHKVDACPPPSVAPPEEPLNGLAHPAEAEKESENEATVEEDETKEEAAKEEGNGVATVVDGESKGKAEEALSPSSPSLPPPPPLPAVAEEDKEEKEEEEEEEKEEVEEEETINSSKPSEVTLGPKTFRSSSHLFHFVSELLHAWPLNFNVNKYERLVMTDLVQKGYPDPMTKIGAGIETFQVRMNPEYDSRCFYVMRKDGSMEDFSFRKCVDSLMGLPDDLRHHNGRNHHHGGKGGGRNQGYNKSGGKGRHGRGFNGRGHGRGRGGYRRG